MGANVASTTLTPAASASPSATTRPASSSSSSSSSSSAPADKNISTNSNNNNNTSSMATAPPAPRSPAPAMPSTGTGSGGPSTNMTQLLEATRRLNMSLHHEVVALQKALFKSVEGALQDHAKHQESVLTQHASPAKRLSAGARTSVVSMDAPLNSDLAKVAEGATAVFYPFGGGVEEGGAVAAIGGDAEEAEEKWPCNRTSPPAISAPDTMKTTGGLSASLHKGTAGLQEALHQSVDRAFRDHIKHQEEVLQRHMETVKQICAGSRGGRANVVSIDGPDEAPGGTSTPSPTMMAIPFSPHLEEGKALEGSQRETASFPEEVHVAPSWERASLSNLAHRGTTFLGNQAHWGESGAKFFIAMDHGSWTHRKLYDIFGSWLEFYWGLEEPPRTSRLAGFVDGSIFAQISAIVIMMNAVQSAVSANEQIAGRSVSGALQVWETAFMIFYTVELGLKLWVHRVYFFLNSDRWWNIFDCALVALGIFDVVSGLDGDDSNNGNTQFAFLRMLRILRAGRALRSLRALRAVTELRTLLTSVVKSVASLFWSVCMIVFIYYIFSLIIVQVSIAYEDAPQEEFLVHFGSVQQSMLTLFILSLGGGDLQNFYDFLDPDLNRVIIVVFMLLFQITLLNILTGVYVEAAMKYAQPHRSVRAKALQVQEFEDAEELWAFFASNFNSGEISSEELAEFMKRPSNEAFIETFDIHIEPDLMYRHIAEKEGRVTLEGLVKFILWHRGPMTKMDILRTDRVLKDVRSVMSRNTTTQEWSANADMGALTTFSVRPSEGVAQRHVTLVVPHSHDASDVIHVNDASPSKSCGIVSPQSPEESAAEPPRSSKLAEAYKSEAWNRASFSDLATRGNTFLETQGRFSNKRVGAKFQIHIDHGSWTHQKLYDVFGSWLEFFWALEEPPRTGCLATFVDGTLFAQLSAIVIMLNAVQSAMAANEQIADRPISGFLQAWETGNMIFYSIELGLKLWVHRFFFFLNQDRWWNIFDLVLVALALFDLFTSLDGDDSGGSTQFAFLRMLRILRAGRALRSLRALRAVTELRTLLTSVVKSVASLFWSVCMILFIYYIFSLIIVQVSVAYEDTPSDDFLENFGSVQQSMLTLFILSLGGGDLQNFYDFLDPVLNKVIIVLFVLLFQITLLNILTGVYVEAAMKYAQPHRTARAKTLQVQEFEDAEELWAFFASNLPSDEITKEKLSEFLKRPTNESYMETFDIHVDPDLMYHDIVEREGKVTLENLVKFVLWNRGPMTKMDILRTNRKLQEVRKWVRTSIRPSNAVQANASEFASRASDVEKVSGGDQDTRPQADGHDSGVRTASSGDDQSDEWVGLVVPPPYSL